MTMKRKHAVDQSLRAVDPQMRALEDELDKLAGVFRALLGFPGEQAGIVKEYHAVFEKLYALGWDGDLGVESELPDEFMPERYLKTVYWYKYQ
jgi:sugar phosphate isomerase/epimerase